MQHCWTWSWLATRAAPTHPSGGCRSVKYVPSASGCRGGSSATYQPPRPVSRCLSGSFRLLVVACPPPHAALCVCNDEKTPGGIEKGVGVTAAVFPPPIPHFPLHLTARCIWGTLSRDREGATAILAKWVRRHPSGARGGDLGGGEERRCRRRRAFVRIVLPPLAHNLHGAGRSV